MFVEVTAVQGRIVLELRYATANNIVGRPLYDRATCLLQQDVAAALRRVAARLSTRGYGLKLYDCFRPQAAQEALARVESDPRYVADPRRGSRHTRGAAVDLTLIDRAGHELEMPTPFDESSPRAHRDAKTMNATARRHLQILDEAMTHEGFVGLRTEWWHYDFGAWSRFAPIATGWPRVAKLLP